MCPTQQEEAPRKLQSTLERAGEMPSPLKGNTHSFGKVEEPGKGEGKVGNWGEKYPDSFPNPRSYALSVHKHWKLFEGSSNAEY